MYYIYNFRLEALQNRQQYTLIMPKRKAYYVKYISRKRTAKDLSCKCVTSTLKLRQESYANNNNFVIHYFNV